MQSILQAFQDDKIRRVKIGIGKPAAGQAVVDYVLSPCPVEQLAVVEAAHRAASDRVLDLIREALFSKSSSREEGTELRLSSLRDTRFDQGKRVDQT